MKIEKTYLEIDHKKINTYLTVYFEGNKEEISLENKTIYLCCGEEDTFEYWIKIHNIDEDMFLKYISNEEKLYNVIKNSEILLYKRFYESYHLLIFSEDLRFDELYKKEELILPNEFATLGYNFYNLYRKQEAELYDIFKTVINQEYNQTIISKKREMSGTINVNKTINYNSFNSVTLYSSNFDFKRVA
ncbi:hypothetical protein GCM10012288_19090 [Malaciobacter pacificus]|nr:hypothetical protein [Malaciobacter pacificus]GGD44946.1 hypothetical protein GCM10012288_19090 [Malaciobacter pacificus]